MSHYLYRLAYVRNIYLYNSVFRFLNSSFEISAVSRRDFNFSHSAFLYCFLTYAKCSGEAPETVSLYKYTLLTME